MIGFFSLAYPTVMGFRLSVDTSFAIASSCPARLSGACDIAIVKEQRVGGKMQPQAAFDNNQAPVVSVQRRLRLHKSD